MSSEQPLPKNLAARRAEVRGPRLRRWEQATERPLAVVGLLFLVAYTIPVAFPDLDPAVRNACYGFLALTWVIFVADYVVRVSLARRRWTYVRNHPIALLVVLVPALQPLLLVSMVGRVNENRRRRLRGKVVRYAAVGTILLVVTSSLLVTQLERWRPDATIKTLGDGIWWAFVTVTTVGYGDMAPVSPLGRTIGVVLMLGGIALLGVVTATLSSWLVEVITVGRPDEDGDVDRIDDGAPDGDLFTVDAPGAGPGLSMVPPEQVALLTAELRALRSEIADLRRRMPGEPS